MAGATIGSEALSRDRAERLASFFRAWGGAAGVVTLLAALLRGRADHACQPAGAEPGRRAAAQHGRARRAISPASSSATRCSAGCAAGCSGSRSRVLTIIALLYSSRRMELAGSIELGLRPVDWILLACVPVLIAALPGHGDRPDDRHARPRPDGS